MAQAVSHRPLTTEARGSVPYSTCKDNDQTTQKNRLEHHLRHNATQQQDSGSTPSTVSRAWQLSTPYVPITYYITSK
jgi:hypothetical protein